MGYIKIKTLKEQGQLAVQIITQTQIGPKFYKGINKFKASLF